MSNILEQYEEEMFCPEHHIPLVLFETDEDSYYVCPECEREKGIALGWQ